MLKLLLAIHAALQLAALNWLQHATLAMQLQAAAPKLLLAIHAALHPATADADVSSDIVASWPSFSSTRAAAMQLLLAMHAHQLQLVAAHAVRLQQLLLQLKVHQLQLQLQLLTHMHT